MRRVRHVARGTMTLAIGSALLGVLSTLPAVAAAQQGPDRSQARALFEQGVQAARRSDYGAAVRAFQRSYALVPLPGTLMNLALFEERAGARADAYGAWSELLDRFGGQISAEARARANTRRAALARQLATVQVETDPGALLLVDGRERGRAPLSDPLHLEPGTHTFVARLAGHQDAHVEQVVAVGSPTTVRLALGPRVVEHPAATTTAADTGSGPSSSVAAGAVLAVPSTIGATSPSTAGGHAALRSTAPLAVPSTTGATPPSTAGGHAVLRSTAPLAEPSASSSERPRAHSSPGFWHTGWPWAIGGGIVVVATAVVLTALLLSNGSNADWTLQVR